MKNMCMSDLHLHFDGSLSLKIVETLLKLNYNKDKKPQGWDEKSDEEKKKMLCVPEECESLNDYLKCFDLPCSLLQTPEAVKLAMKMFVEELDSQGLVYADIRFAPQLFSEDLKNELLNGENRQLTEKEQLKDYERTIIQAALDGIKEAKTTNLEANLILCCMRNKNWGSQEEGQKANIRTIKLAKEFDEKEGSPRIVKLDIAGGEAGNPNSDYKSEYETYKACNMENIKLTIHSGEAGDLEERLNNIELAIKAGANIGHGVALSCVYDDKTPSHLKEKAIELMKQIKEKGIKLEVCITSNYQTKAVSCPHPILKLMLGDEENDIPSLIENITINTDNMTVSDTTIAQEYGKFMEICRESEMKQEEIDNLIAQLQINGIEASSMDEEKKRKIISSINSSMRAKNSLGSDSSKQPTAPTK